MECISVNDLQDVKPINQLLIKDVLPYSLYATPIVSISKKDKVWTASTMLRFFLESFTDQLVVMENKKPCGFVGGYDVLYNILKNPTRDFFGSTLVEQIMQNDFLQINEKQNISDLIQKWHKNRRAFSIISHDSNFFAVSARSLLDVYPFLDTCLTINDLPKKKTIYFTKDQSVKEILNLMFENKTRRLILKDSEFYVSDRLIIETICTELNYLEKVDNFLEMDCSIFKLDKAKIIPEYTTIQKLCKLMNSLNHQYTMCGDQVFSPFDIIMILERDDVYYKELEVKITK